MLFLVHLFFSVFGLFCNQCNLINAKALIGENIRQATENEFPYVVAISQIDQTNLTIIKVICMGTMISKHDVLSSEHCLDNENVQNLQIIGGSINITSGTKYPLQWWLTYDQWATYTSIKIEFPKNDIAILRLIPNEANILTPAFISYLPNESLYGLFASIATWTLSNTGQLSPIMETANVVIISNPHCENICMSLSEKVIKVPNRMLCSVAEPCVILSPGDSGGPLLYEESIIAVNTGVYPPFHASDESSYPNKVNYHFGLNYYKLFITCVMAID